MTGSPYGLWSLLAGLFRKAPAERGPAPLPGIPVVGMGETATRSPNVLPKPADDAHVVVPKPDPIAIPKPAGGHIAPAIELLHHYEACRLVPYKDAVGIPTIGWGNTRWEDGRKVSMADPAISQARADRLFAFWLVDFDLAVTGMLPANADDGVRAAFLCFAYNVGVTGAKGSTALRLLKEGNRTAAAGSLALWNKAGGKVLKGLQRRRHAEGCVLLGDSPKAAIVKAEKVFP